MPSSLETPYRDSVARVNNVGGIDGEILNAEINETYQGVVSFSCLGYDRLNYGAQVILGVSVQCQTGRTPSPVFVRVGGYISSVTGGFAGTEPCLSGWYWYFNGDFDVPMSSCMVKNQRSCSTGSEQFQFINTPLTFTLTKSGCTLSGSFSNHVEKQFPAASSSSFVESYGQAVKDAFSYTFRITSRPSCRTVSCNCSADPSGTQWLFQGQAFTYGTSAYYWLDSSQTYTYDGFGSLSYTLYDFNGPFDDDGHSIKILKRERIDVYCSAGTWYAYFRTNCWGYDDNGYVNALAEDSWIGTMLCYEACADEYHAAGDPIPLGEPVNVEYLGRQLTPGYADCGPPARTTVLVQQVVSC
jgi:hypothetical protein